MSAFQPESYAEALALRASRPQKPRKQLKAAGTLKRPSQPLAARISRAKKAKKKRARLITIPKLKKKVWAEFSIYIRTRDADEFGYVQCATCPARHLWNSGEIHAGHWIHGRLDFDERNIHGQCRNDNFYSHTKVNTAYAVFMAKTYGAEVMDELRLLSNTRANKYSRAELDELYLKYRTLNQSHPLVK